MGFQVKNTSIQIGDLRVWGRLSAKVKPHLQKRLCEFLAAPERRQLYKQLPGNLLFNAQHIHIKGKGRYGFGGVTFQYHTSPADLKIIESVSDFVELAHRGQLRKDGTPYFTHPEQVAELMQAAGFGLDEIIIALCHDVLEDGEISYGERITQEYLTGKLIDFGLSQARAERIVRCIDGVSKVGKEIDYKGTTKPDQVAIWGKLLSYGKDDLAIILVKLFDRLHNMRTIEAMSAEAKLRISQETLDFYVPLADALGMWSMKHELEDLAFERLEPDLYKEIKKQVRNLFVAHKKDILKARWQIEENLRKRSKLTEVKIDRRGLFEIAGRMKKRNIELKDLAVEDLFRFSVVLPEEKNDDNCYLAMRDLHALYLPDHNNFNDFIADPRPNGHRFIHDWIKIPGFSKVLVHLASKKMHLWNKQGILTTLGHKDWHKQRLRLIDSLLPHFRREGITKTEIKTLIEAIREPIIVLSPLGEEFILPSNATALDYAAAVHPEVLLKAKGVKINGRTAKLSQQLEAGDVVEIITNKKVHASLESLSEVNTPEAKSVLRRFLSNRAEDVIFRDGMRALEQEIARFHLSAEEFLVTQLFMKYVAGFGYEPLEAKLSAIDKLVKGFQELNKKIDQLEKKPDTSRMLTLLRCADWLVFKRKVFAGQITRQDLEEITREDDTKGFGTLLQSCSFVMRGVRVALSNPNLRKIYSVFDCKKPGELIAKAALGELSTKEIRSTLLNNLEELSFNTGDKFILEIGRGERNVHDVVEKLESYYFSGLRKWQRKGRKPEAFYFAVKLPEDRIGILDEFTSAISKLKFNFLSNAQFVSLRDGKSIICFSLEVMGGQKGGGMVGDIQRKMVLSIAKEFGKAYILNGEQVKALQSAQAKMGAVIEPS